MMKKLLIITLLACLSAYSSSQTFSAHAYEYSDSIFNNPERGFYKYTERSNASSTLELSTLENFRDQGYTLIYRIFYLRDFVDSPISAAYMAKIREDFNKMREAGIKGVIRFAYTSSMNAPYGDATPERVFSHIEQLKPILIENSDVILVLQAGFIGAWGEWYYTDHFASGSPGNVTEEDLAERKELVDRLLDALPKDRMIQLRYVGYKMKLFDDIPVSFEEAYSGSPKSRISHHNDCFVSSENDVGSYRYMVAEKLYLEEDSRFTSIGGETCNWYPSRSNCDTSTMEMERFHWTFINKDYYGPTLDEWKDAGCFDEMLKYLGYRYNLVDAEIQDSTRRNGTFSISFRLKNSGYSNPINPRNVEIVIRNKQSGQLFFYPIHTEIRKQELHTAFEYSLELGIPSFVPDGEYDLFLSLPDPEATLRYNPHFSIRLANPGSWNKALGMNSFNHTLTITSDAETSEYSGQNYFINYSDNQSVRILVDGKSDDWNPVSDSYAGSSGTDPDLLKIWDNSDTLFFLLKGTDLNSNFELLIDADNENNTGMLYGTWTDDSGIDRMLKGQDIYTYNAVSESWDLSSQEVSLAANDTVIEVAVRKDLLREEKPVSIRLGFKYGTGIIPDNKIIPSNTDPLITYEMSHSLSVPILNTSSFCKNVIVSFAPEAADTSSLIFVERSIKADQDFLALTTLSATSGSLSFTDSQLQDNTSYYYRARRYASEEFSFYSDVLSITTENCRYKYPEITSDAKIDDWNAIAPLNAIRFKDHQFIFKSYSDNDYLNLVLSGTTPFLAEIFINTDNDPLTGENNRKWLNSGFDFKYSDGRLYQYISGNYSDIGMLDSVNLADNVLEIKIPLVQLELERTDKILNFTEILQVENTELFIPFSGMTASAYERTLSPEKPQGMSVRNSVNDPSSKLIVTWNKCADCDGYQLTRLNKSSETVNDFDLLYNENQLIDEGLQEGITYEYFVRSYNFGGLSEESDHVLATTTGIENYISKENRVNPWPVPASSFLYVHLPSTLYSTLIKCEIFSIDGQLLLTIPVEHGNEVLTIPLKELSGGLYLLIISSEGESYIRKFIKE